jgi:Ca2+:H+ antiporter
MKLLYQWTVSLPLLACLLYFSGYIYDSVTFQIIAGILLIGSVMSAVHHSEIIAHRVGEPYGTIILAIAITIIEVSVIVSLMISGGGDALSLARDTVYAATMLILNGIVGLCLFIGGLKHHEQTFSKHSVNIALVSLVSIIVFTLILPTFTKSISGPYYSSSQMLFAAVACLMIYTSFIFAQTVRHREYFLADEQHSREHKSNDAHTFVSNYSLIISLVFLLISLTIVVLLAKTLSPSIEEIIVSYNLPKTLVGIVIASIILLPEGIAAIIAARKNKLQTSLNLALGSALASIGLTIPVVSIVCYFYNIQIVLGLDYLSIILLMLSVLTVMLSLNSGRSNIVYGTVLLVNLMAFVYLIVYP